MSHDRDGRFHLDQTSLLRCGRWDGAALLPSNGIAVPAEEPHALAHVDSGFATAPRDRTARLRASDVDGWDGVSPRLSHFDAAVARRKTWDQPPRLWAR